MKCPDEPTLMLLADEELDASAALRVREHVTRCASCRARLADLREERKALVAALGESGFDELAAVPALAASAAPAQAPSGRWSELALAAAVLAVAGVAAWAAGVTALWQVPPFLGWADPFNPLGRFTWLFTGITLGVSAAFAGAALASTVTTIGQIMATLLLMLVLLTVARASRRVVITGLLAVLLTAPAHTHTHTHTHTHKKPPTQPH
ncbi:MAG: zf-HC2 domain-containing protein, partial [Acidobacteria bacterium]|nr:zf-HC2 domain-containing protein [Acidobacteriota bacterium]